MRLRTVLLDSLIGLAAGLIATRITGTVQGILWRLMPEDARQEETDAALPLDPSQTAAKRLARLAGVELTGKGLETGGWIVHYATGLGWTPVYMLLRRWGGLHPAGAALVCGSAMALVLDEGLVPALKLSRGPRAYPWETHARGFVTHIAFGVLVAAAVETLRHPARRTGSISRRRRRAF
ncbi:MAG: hypothetical protein LDL44_05630 [Caenispirillum sp.]|nr:hypothetical protein [Caenispirillum sp.]